MCTYWNSIKYVGDQITQMLWLRKFNPPRLSPQVCSTMKLTFYLPQYQLHRLYQLISINNISSISSLKQYREKARKTTTLFDSMKATRSIIDSMLVDNDTPSSQDTSQLSTPRISSRLIHPLVIREKGVSDITICHGPITGSTPQQYLQQYYSNESNKSSHLIINRRKSYRCNPIMMVDEKGRKKKKMSYFTCGGRSMLVYCTICHHNFCFDVNQKKTSEANQFAAINTDTKDKDGKPIFKYGIMSCYHHEHPASYTTNVTSDTTDLPRVT